MASLEDIREGLATNLRIALPGTEGQVSAYMLDVPTGPTLQVLGPDEATPTSFGRGGESLLIIVQGLCGKISDIGAQKRLDRWWATTGSESVTTAIESDKQLGGAASDLVVVSKGGYQIYVVGEAQTKMLGAEWRVQIETSD